jgi:hypothetical protein
LSSIEWRQDDLRNYCAAEGYLTPGEALDDAKLAKFFDDPRVWMEWTYIEGKELTLEYLGGDSSKGERKGKLRFGHVYLGIPAVGYGHIVVVYGVGYPDGKSAQISIMDPMPGVYRNVRLTEYMPKRNILVAWPKSSVPPKW